MNVNDLRKTLFETLDAVKNGSMKVDQAKAVSEIAQTIINTAKVEIDFIRATDADVQSEFIPTGRTKVIPAIPSRPGLLQQIESAGKKSA